MTGPIVTVRHTEQAIQLRHLDYRGSQRFGLDVDAEIHYAPGQTGEALEAVKRMTASLRKQIADAAERVTER